MAAENDVLSEIEVLQSIYLDELKVTQKENGGWEYPSIPPVISINNPRGLSDDKLLSVQRCLQMEAESCPGAPVLYQVIEKAKEILTDSNIPHGNCVICLFGFKDGEAFTKTSCYHYFHSHCLGRYISHSEMELREREKEIEEDKTRGMMEGEELAVVCPVCREPLACDVDALLSAPAPASPEMTGEVVGAEFRHKWVQLQRILERQRRKGGIIDPEAESNRFLIHINEGPSEASDPASGISDLPPSPLETQPPVIQPSLPQPPPGFGQGNRRGNPGRRGRGHNRGGRRGGGGHMHAEIPETVHNLTKLSLASEKRNHVRADATAFNGTCVDTGSCGDLREQEVKPAEEDKLVDVKGQESTDANKSEALLTTDQALQLNSTESSTEDVKAPRQVPSTERPHSRGHWQRGRRRGPHHQGQQPGQWQDRNFRDGETRDPVRGMYHHRGHRGRGRGGSGGGGSHQSRGGGGGGPHRGAPRDSHQRRTESGSERPVL